MQKKHLLYCSISILALFVFLILFNPDPSSPTCDSGDIQNKGTRLLGIDVNQYKDGDYNAAFTLAKDAGMQFISISQGWEDLEPTAGIYDDRILDIMNVYYPVAQTKVALIITPIDTNVNRLPSDLKGRPFNDSVVINRFNQLLSHVLSKISAVSLVCLSIGNEIDIYLQHNETLWGQYIEFFNATSSYAHTLNNSLIIGCKATYNGLTQNNIQELMTLNEHSDGIFVTYYPLENDYRVKDPNVVCSEFKSICEQFNGKSVYFLETGFPSSTICQSSEQMQMQFISNVFAAWDNHSAQIPAVMFNWLHDKSQAELDTFSTYYGIFDAKFVAYLGSIGLRTNDNQDKSAFTKLKTEADKRGW